MSDDRYDDDHVGEMATQWPPHRIEIHPEMQEAALLVEDIRECRGCSEEHGLCARHNGMIQGYNRAVDDMNTAFDITKEDYPDELLEADQ